MKRVKINAIAINFGDNDFGNTFRPLMAGLYEAIDWEGGDYEMSKEEVVAYANIVFPAVYAVFQNKFEYNGLEKLNKTDLSGLEDSKEFKNIKEALKLKVEDVAFNEEISEFLENYGGNGETVILGMNNGNITIN